MVPVPVTPAAAASSFEGGEGEGLDGKGKGLLPYCLSHLALFSSTLNRHAYADHRGCHRFEFGRYL
jgi:hypothetical protein